MTETPSVHRTGYTGWRRRPSRNPWILVIGAGLPIGIALVGAGLQAGAGEGAAGLSFLLAVVTLAVGGSILMGLPSARPVAVALLVGALIWALAALSFGLMSQWGSAHPGVEPIGLRLLRLSFQVFWMFLTPGVPLALFYLFPTGLMPRAWFRSLFAVSLTAFTCATAVLAFHEFLIGRDLEDYWAWNFYWQVLGLSLVLGMAALVIRWLGSRSPVRKQLAAFGFVQVFFIGALIFGLFRSWSDQALVFFQVGWLVGILASIAYGVARHRLYDVRVVVRRVFVYGMTTVALTGVFVAVYVLLTAGLSQGLDTGSPFWVPAVAAVVVVLLLEPVRRRLVTRLESRYLGDRQRALQTIARLDIEGNAGTATTYDRIVELVVSAVRAPAAGLALAEGGETHMVANHGSLGDKPLAIPVQYRGELLGQIRVARRTANEAYTTADLSLLEQLAGQAAAHIFAVRRDHELSQSRREALTAIAEDRAKLGRDLHDELAPLLAGAGLTAEALRLDLEPNSPGEQDAARLAVRLRHAAGEVRRIAHGLDPGELGQNLDDAVGAYLDGLHGPGMPTFTAHLDVDNLPRVVAHAAYMVILEAIHNIVGHAAATHAEITLQSSQGDLVLQVADDGRGLPQPYVSGFGVTSMRRRIEALDGTFTIEARPSGGTRIQALIPLDR